MHVAETILLLELGYAGNSRPSRFLEESRTPISALAAVAGRRQSPRRHKPVVNEPSIWAKQRASSLSQKFCRPVASVSTDLCKMVIELVRIRLRVSMTLAEQIILDLRSLARCQCLPVTSGVTRDASSLESSSCPRHER